MFCVNLQQNIDFKVVIGNINWKQIKSSWTRYNLLRILHGAKTHAQKTIDRTVVTMLLQQPDPQSKEAKVVIYT